MESRTGCLMTLPADEFPTIDRGQVPALDAAQMREVDRLMTEVYFIQLEQMMENAGRCLAHLARRRFPAAGSPGRPVLVMAGSGGNGGGALAAARRLSSWDFSVRVALAAEPARITGVPAHQLQMAAKLGLPGTSAAADPATLPPNVSLVIDGLIGYTLQGAPRGNFARMIHWANTCSAPVLELDIPSGLDASSGQVMDPCVRAAATLTLALPKKGLFTEAARERVGELYLADIGVPPQLYAEPTLDLSVESPFHSSDSVRVH
jgi:NAD(P)H-hydrate epimerase